jgi:flagellar basal-body rod protein FlgF
VIDRFAFTSMTGAKHAMGQLANTSHNLANVNTPGFRELLSAFRAVPVAGASSDSRAFVVDSTPRADFQPGTLITTNNPLDIAIEDKGFLVIQREDGTEAFTRAGRMRLDSEGMLRGPNNSYVLGRSGPIRVPENSESVEISADGSVSTLLAGQKTPLVIAQLRLVNPRPHELNRAGDGFFEHARGNYVQQSEAVRVVQGAYEGSNVSAAAMMVQMIQQNRLYDLNVRMIQAATQNSEKASSLMSLSRI